MVPMTIISVVVAKISNCSPKVVLWKNKNEVTIIIYGIKVAQNKSNMWALTKVKKNLFGSSAILN